MIIYFADRHFNILGLASSNLQNGLHIVNDTKSESIESGVKTFECELTFDENSRADLENCTEAGNFVLRSQDDENEFYTIIETTIDILNSSIVVYCEDAGLDMINDVAAAAAAPDTAQGVDYYISRYTANSGFQIGTNEISGLKRTLSWDGESTAAERIRSIANQFNNAEIGFSFDIKGLFIETKYINIYKKRGDDRGVTLRLGHEINNITISKSVANLASALFVKGGQDSAGKTITLKGYEYDDGDIYSPRDSAYLYCRSANAKWSRKNWEQISGSGWLTKQYSYETTSQSTLCSHAVTELKKLKDTEINYEIEISDFNNKQIEIGDTIYIVDDQGELYLSARVLELETSITNSSMTATLGDYLIKNSGINDKVLQLANDFQNIVNNLENAQQTPVLQIESSNGLIFKTGIETTALNVTIYRGNAQIKDISELRATFGETAQLIWSYLSDSVYVQIPATDSRLSNDAFTLTVSSADVTEKLTFKCEVVIDNETVEIIAANQVTLAKVADGEGMSEEQIAKLNQASADATQAKTDASAAKSTADSAQIAANTAQTTADGAATAASTAQATANTAKGAAQSAQQAAESAQSAADTAQSTATAASTAASNAQSTADQAQSDAAAASSAAASAQNSAQNAQTAAQNAQETAQNAQNSADQASSAAAQAQAKADQAANAAATAESKATAATTAASRAESSASAASTAAANAQSTADNAASAAATAQTKANAAATAAESAETAASAASSAAARAQATAEGVSEIAESARTKANEASASAAEAKTTAESVAGIAQQAQESASTAQTAASQAVSDAASASTAAASAGRAAAVAQAAAEAAQVDIDETQTYFYHDPVGGAHVLGNNYRTDVKDGLQIVRVADNMPLASFEEKLVKIGEDSVDAEVQLCGGAGGIKYDKLAHRLHIGNKIDGAERIIIETNFDTYGYESGPYGTVQLSRSDGTAAKEGKFNIYASDGQDGKEAYIEAVCRSTPDSAPYEMLENSIDIIARNIFMGTEMFNNATIELDANNVIIGKKNGVQFDTAHNVKMYGNVTVDDFKVLTEGDIGYTITRIGGTNYTTDLSSGTNTIKDVATISLPPGLWLVMINARFTPTNSGTHITSMALTENSESAAVHDRRYGSTTYYNQHNFTTLVDLRDKSAGTTMYLTGQSTLAGSWNRKSSAQLSIKAIQMGL